MRLPRITDYRVLALLPALLVAPSCTDDGNSDDATSTVPEPSGSGDSTGATDTPTTTETPDTDTPTTDAPTTDAPTTDAPTTDAPTGDTGSTGDGFDVASCRYRCEETTDCFFGGVDNNQICDDGGNCVSPCEEEIDCVASTSGWSLSPCTTNDECNGGFCVDYGEGMGCAFAPLKGMTCADGAATNTEFELPDADGNTVTVCGNASWTCDAGTCVPGESFHCDQTGCPDSLTCNAEGNCECDSDEACVDAGYGDACRNDGFCVESCDGTCEGEPAQDGGAIVCE